MPQELPLEFEPDYYRDTYPDLKGFDDVSLRLHYEAHGRGEGRLASPASHREAFLQLIPSKSNILEIGPFDAPCFIGENVKYFDVLDRTALKDRARELSRSPDRVPNIDYVDPNGDLAIIDETFDTLFSAHCIEHQPDLVYHIQQADALLGKGGRYFMVVPDKHYCFDHYVKESTIADVLEASKSRYLVHRLTSVIEHHALSTHNDAGRHWQGDHADGDYGTDFETRIRASLDLYDVAKGGYIDVHAWKFTPRTFRDIMQMLFDLGLTRLRPERVYDTPRPTQEFTAVLQKV